MPPLWVFPLVAGTTWLTILFSLVCVWLLQGCPKYPGQRNPILPYVSFCSCLPHQFHFSQLLKSPRYVSDIGAYDAKPIFQYGSMLFAFSLVITVHLLNYARYAPEIYDASEHESLNSKLESQLAIISSVVAGFCLICLSGPFDAFHFPRVHLVFLGFCIIALDCTSGFLMLAWRFPL